MPTNVNKWCLFLVHAVYKCSTWCISTYHVLLVVLKKWVTMTPIWIRVVWSKFIYGTFSICQRDNLYLKNYVPSLILEGRYSAIYRFESRSCWPQFVQQHVVNLSVATLCRGLRFCLWVEAYCKYTYMFVIDVWTHSSHTEHLSLLSDQIDNSC